MKDEFREWNETKEVNQQDEIGRRTEERTESLWNEVENVLDHLNGELRAGEATEKREAAGEKEVLFSEFPPVKLMDGLTMETVQRRMKEHSERSAEAAELKETVEVSDYTSDAYIDEWKMHHYGQVDPEKLTDAALEHISGEPEISIPLWREQTRNYSCGAASLTMVLKEKLDPLITEEEVIRKAEELGVISERKGMYFDGLKVLCDHYGLESEIISVGTIRDMEKIHDAGGRVIATVNSARMAYPGIFGFYLTDHAVEVVGIDRNDPHNVRVILNDPGRSDGRGLSVPADVFDKARGTIGKTIFAVYGRKEL